MNAFPVVRESAFTCDMISKCVKTSKRFCTLSCSCNGIRVALCFLNTAVAFKGRFGSTFFCQHQI